MLAQTAVDEKTNEISAVHTVLAHVLLAGRVVTRDALLTQRAVAQTSGDHGGDDVMVAKDKQPRLRQDIAGLLATPAHLAAPLRSVQTVDKGQGRIARRHLTARALLPGDGDWPGAQQQQVFRLERRVIRTTTGEVHTAVLAGRTSAPKRPLRLSRACVASSATKASKGTIRLWSPLIARRLSSCPACTTMNSRARASMMQAASWPPRSRAMY
jgi:hypothetical protein